MQGRAVRGLRRKIVHQHAIAVSLQLLREMQPGRFFRDVGVGLVGDAKNQHGRARRNLFLYFGEEIRLGQLVEFIGRLRQRGLGAGLTRGIRQQAIVPRETGTAKT